MHTCKQGADVGKRRNERKSEGKGVNKLDSWLNRAGRNDLAPRGMGKGTGAGIRGRIG